MERCCTMVITGINLGAAAEKQEGRSVLPVSSSEV